MHAKENAKVKIPASSTPLILVTIIMKKRLVKAYRLVPIVFHIKFLFMFEFLVIVSGISKFYLFFFPFKIAISWVSFEIFLLYLDIATVEAIFMPISTAIKIVNTILLGV